GARGAAAPLAGCPPPSSPPEPAPERVRPYAASARVMASLMSRTQRQGGHRVARAVVAVRDGNSADVRVGLPLRRPRHHRVRGDDLARLAMFACDVPKTARVHR